MPASKLSIIVLCIVLASLLSVAAASGRSFAPGSQPDRDRNIMKPIGEDFFESGRSYTIRIPSKATYFSANGDGSFTTTASFVSHHEQFGFKKVGVSSWTLRTFNGQYVCLDGGKKQFETRSGVGDWEKFEFQATGVPNTYFMYSPHHDVYINFDGSVAKPVLQKCMASTVVILPEELSPSKPQQHSNLESGRSYTIQIQGKRTYLKANSDGSFTSNALPNLQYPAIFNQGEQFVFSNVLGSKWALKTQFGKYVCFNKGFETRDSVGDWEKFEFHPTGEADTYHMYIAHLEVYINFESDYDTNPKPVTLQSQASKVFIRQARAPVELTPTAPTGTAPTARPTKTQAMTEPTSPSPPLLLYVIQFLGLCTLVSLAGELVVAVFRIVGSVWRGTYRYFARVGRCEQTTEPAVKVGQLESGKAFALRLPSGCYFSANPDGKFNANAPHCRDWEQFTFSKVGVNRWSLRTFHDRFVCFDQGKKLFETRDIVGPWEKFEFHPASNSNTYYMYNAHQDVYISFSDGHVREVFSMMDATPLNITSAVVDRKRL